MAACAGLGAVAAGIEVGAVAGGGDCAVAGAECATLARHAASMLTAGLWKNRGLSKGTSDSPRVDGEYTQCPGLPEERQKPRTTGLSQ